MKYFLHLISLTIAMSTSAQTTRYSPGFEFYSHDGVKHKLVKWTIEVSAAQKIEHYKTMPDGVMKDHLIKTAKDSYRWRVLLSKNGVSAMGWTSDELIDLYTGKAFLDERRHKIVPLDTLEKWYPDYAERIENSNFYPR